MTGRQLNIMDLKDRLTDCINANVNLPVKLYQSYMTNKTSPELRIYDLPSITVDEDYAGNRTEEFIFEIAMRSNDEELINQTLWDISKYISDYDFDLVSQNNSFSFNKLEVTTFPHIVSADTEGNVVYLFDFKITVDTYKESD